MKLLLQYFQKIFSVDLRALAFMRIWVAAIIITDLVIRATDLEAHYSNMGVLPLHVLFQHTWNPYYISFHTLSGLWQVQAVLFGIAALFAFLLLIGYKTRLVTIVSWILMVSLHNRNTLISQGGDDLLRMLLFWAMFMPWGKYYSLDTLRKKETPARPEPYVSIATAAYILQICIMYFCTAMLKNAPEWRTEGTALYYALSLDQILMPGGRLIYPYPELLKVLTHFTFYTELLLPLVLFIPVYTTFFRLVFVGVLTSFHVGISLTLFVGLFYLINFASLAGFLPPVAMDWLDKKVFPHFSRIGFYIKSFFNSWQPPISIQLNRPTWLSTSRTRFIRETTVLLLLFYVVWWNANVALYRGKIMNDNSRWFGNFLRIDQYWGMFAPAVFKDDGWYILEGITSQNRHVDLNQEGEEPDFQKPASVMSLFKNDRWRKYSENYLFVQHAFMRPYYCNYLLRRWNEEHPNESINTLDVIYMKEVSLPNYQTALPMREVLCSCSTMSR